MDSDRRTQPKWLNLSSIADFVSLGQWIVDKTFYLYAFAVSVAGATFLASFAARFAGWTPFAWASLGVSTFAAIAAVLVLLNALLAWSRSQRAIAEVWEASARSASVNPLQDVFSRETIRIHELMSPAGAIVENKIFINCDLIGPASVVLSGSSLSFKTLANVEATAISSRSISSSPNKVAFVGCKFHDCRLFNVTLLVPAEMVGDFKKHYKINWLSD